jgi:predicted phage tail protein
LGEGPFQGIVGGYQSGAKNIFFNDTPLMNEDGSLNFTGVTWDYRVGTPDQSWIEGFPAVESTHSGDVGLPTEIKRSTPATRSITNTNVNAVRIVIAVQGMLDQDTKTGDTRGTSVSFVIRVRRQGRSGWEQEYRQTITGKTTSAYEEQYRVPMPGDGPWDIMVERTTPDSDRATLQNSTSWSSYTEIIDRKLRYPNTALLALTFDAQRFGNSMPTVTSRWDTWIVRVPSNYDPVSRNYAGVWDGGWKMAYTANPAYLFMALLTHRSGCDLPDSAVDAAAVYSCGRYCDEYVPSGLKNADGSDIMEPRFEAHFVHNTRQEAYAIVNALASTFRAMAYWAAGQVTVVQDAPRDPLFTVNATQTIGGFELAGPAVRAIKTVALVSFLDADNLDKPDLEVYEDFDLIKKYGWQPESITAFACKSRGQAKRLGKWFIETGKLGDALTYKASIDHLHANPGDVIVMTEKSIVGADLGGRVVVANRGTIQLDRAVTIDRGKGYTLHVQLPDGTVGSRTVINQPGTTNALAYDRELPIAPYPEATWVLEVSDLRPRKFRVMAVSDDGDLEYTVAAVPYDDTIYARVERGLNIKQPPVSKLPNPGIVQPPTNVRVDRQYISTPNGWTTALELSWDPSPDPYVKGYTVRYRRNNGNFDTITDVQGTTKTIYGESTGLFVFHVQAVNIGGVESRPAILEINIPDNSPITLIRPTGLELENQGNNHIFQGRDPVFVWRGTAIRGSYDIGQEPAVGAGYLDAIFRDYEVRVYDVRNELIHVDHTTLNRYEFTFDVNSQTKGGPHRSFKFEVLMRDRWGNYSLPAAIEVSNPAPAQVTSLEVLGGYGSIFIKFDQPTDLDFAGSLVWMSDTSGTEPTASNVAYDGPNRYIFLQVPPSVDRYIRVAAYDSFGKTGLNVSAEVKVRSAGVVPPDLTPPGVPTGLALSDEVREQEDGTQTYILIATWNANADGDFLNYGVEIAQEGGQFLHYQTNLTRYEWQVQAGVRYRVRLSAYDKEFNSSIFSAEVAHVVRGDNVPPATPTGLTITATFKSIWVEWDQHPDSDFSHMEVWEASVNDRAQAAYVANAAGTSFVREGLDGGVDRWYWIRAVDRSRNQSAFFPTLATAGVGGRTKKVEEADYAALSIGTAVIKDGAIDNAKIANLDASKITAGSILSGEVILGSTGQTIQQATAGTGDPAAVINQGTTRILPGKILLDGGTTLENILWGPDRTTIDGSKIATGTVSANKLIVGLRGIEIIGCEFTPFKEENIVRWTAGVINYPSGTDGQHAAETISAGGYPWTGNIVYLYWHIGQGAIGGSTDANITANPNVVVLGTYVGGAGLNMTYGRTIIDGQGIRARTIGADRIQANSITANEVSAGRLITASAQIDQGIINTAHINSASVLDAFIQNLSADRIANGSLSSRRIQVGGTFGIDRNTIVIEGRDGYQVIRYHDNNSVTRVEIGQNRSLPDPNIDGLIVRDINGRIILHANGFGVQVIGTDNLLGQATYGMSRTNDANGHTLGWTSLAGGDIHVLAVAMADIGYTTSVNGNNQIAVSDSFQWRMLLNGNVVHNGIMAGAGGATTSLPMSYVFREPPGTGLAWQVQSLGANGWASFGSGVGGVLGPFNFRCQIIAVEYKR